MRGYDRILAITILRDDPTGEMRGSFETLQRKFLDRDEVANVICDTGDWKAVDTFTRFMALATESFDRLNSDCAPQTLGIYIGMHGNINTSEVEPAILGASIAKFAIEYRYNLRKVCVDSCYSAGPEDYEPPAEDTSIVVTTAKEIKGYYVTHSDLKALVGCKIAGYRAVVLKYHEGARSFQVGDHATTRNQTIERVKDAHTVYGNGSRSSLRPHLPAGFKFPFQNNLKTTLIPSASKKAGNEQISVTDIRANQALRQYIEKLDRYLRLKRAWEFKDSLDWKEIPLSEYSDKNIFADYVLEPSPAKGKGYRVKSVLRNVFEA